MGSGCLSPSPGQKDLAIFLTEQIHNAVVTVSRESVYLDTGDEYLQIKQKINKMSNLKKLIDFLHSHRHKISDALAHSLKLCTQKATLQNWIKGLIILERMINMCFQHVSKQRNNSKALKILNILLNQQSSADNSQRKTEHQAILIRRSEKENQSLPTYNYHLVDNLLNEIQNVRFQTLALTLLRGCLAQEDLCSQVLTVLDKYLLIRSNCLQNDDKAMQIQQCLFQKIGYKHLKLKSLQTYVKLISKVREKKLLGVMKQFNFFIKRWIKIKSGNFSNTIKEMTDLQTQVSSIEFIINKFIHCALIQLAYDPIVSNLLQIYSTNNYDIFEEFQDFSVGVLKSIDMGQTVLKFMALGFLYSGLRKSMMGDVEGLLEFNNRFFKDQAKALDSKSLQKLMCTLQRWLLKKKIVKVQEIIKYHSSLFIRFFAQILANDNKKLNELVKRIYQQILNTCSNQMIIFLNECIYGEYEKKQTLAKLRSNLLQLSHMTLSKNRIHTETKIIRFTLDPTYLTVQETTNFYIYLCYFYGKFDNQTVQLYIEEICELLSHIRKLIKNQELNNGQSSSLIKAVLDFLTEISQCKFLLIAFEEVLQSAEKETVTTTNQECMKQLSMQVSGLLKKSKIELVWDEDNKIENLHEKSLLQCKRYFHKMGDMALQSKIARRQQQFQSKRSFIKQSCGIQEDQQQSFKDIMQMINL